MNTTRTGVWAADISEFSVDIFKLNLSTKLQHDSSNERALGKTLPRANALYTVHYKNIQAFTVYIDYSKPHMTLLLNFGYCVY